MTEATAKAEQSAVGPLAAALGRDILSAIVGQVKAQPDHWHRMNEITQRHQLDRMRDATRQIVHHAVRSLVSGAQYKAIACKLDGLTFKDGIKGTFLLTTGADGRHELADAVGKSALIVLADADEYMARMDEVKETADQMELFGGNYDPSVDQPSYRRDEQEDRLSPARQGLMSWTELKARMSEGLITKEQAEQEFGGPLPDKPPVERVPTEDEKPDPLDVLDNIVGPDAVDIQNLFDNVVAFKVLTKGGREEGLPRVLQVNEGETLRRAIERLFPGCVIVECTPPPLSFGQLSEEENAERVLHAVILERLFALGYAMSLGALQALEPEQLAQLKAWNTATDNTPADQPVPEPPEWLPKNEPGQNQTDNQKE